MLRNIVAVWAAFPLLLSCAHEPVRTRLIDVSVPVAVECPAPPVLVRPALLIDALTPQSAADEVMRAYVTSLDAAIRYALELEQVIEGYR